MRIAIIDLGTNTFNLLISQFDQEKITSLYSTKLSVRLGEGSFKEGFISEQAIERALLALKNFIQISKDYNTDKVIAFATSAVRNAKNKSKFLELVKTNYNIDINVIDGNKEAEYIYKGVRSALDMGEEISLIMDIGGGSTEFIISNNKQIFWKQSFEIGVARLLEKFKPSDPIKSFEIKKLEQYFEQELNALFENAEKYPFDTLIGSSGSFDSFAEIIAYKFYDLSIIQNKTNYDFNLTDYKIIHSELLNSNLEQRLQTKGIIEMRADMIVVATVMVNFIIERLKLNKMKLSTYSLKEGVMSEIKNGLLKA